MVFSATFHSFCPTDQPKAINGNHAPRLWLVHVRLQSQTWRTFLTNHIGQIVVAEIVELVVRGIP